MRYEPRSSKSGAGTFLNKQNLAHEKSNTELLQEIEDTLRSGTVEDMDTDKIEYYLSILQERAPVEEDYDPEQQWSELREAHPLIFSVEDTPSEKSSSFPAAYTAAGCGGPYNGGLFYGYGECAGFQPCTVRYLMGRRCDPNMLQPFWYHGATRGYPE